MHVNCLLIHTVNQCCHTFCGVVAPCMRQNTTAFQRFPIIQQFIHKRAHCSSPDTCNNVKMYMIGKVDNIVLKIATEFEIQ